jgi:SAM-dependent methyltransferase
MAPVEETDGVQAARWNGAGGRGWAGMHHVMDQLLQPLEDVLVDAVGDDGGGAVLDVGCGAGATTVAIARRLGSASVCTGIDVSEPLLAAARTRADAEGMPVDFIRADAQRYEFAPASFDTIVSRFGVMFFDDFVEAFGNLRAAVTGDGRLRIIVWRSAGENPFMTTAARAAAPLIAIPPQDPDAPGQFALAEESRVRTILDTSGWREIEVEPIDAVCAFREQDLVRYVTQIGPVGRALADADASTTTRVLAAVRPAFDPYVEGPEVRFTAACWLVRARA